MKAKNGLTGPHLAGDIRYDRWVFGILIEAGPRALNLVSSGAVPIGKPVPTPAVLLNKPLRPPTKAQAA